MRKIKKEYVKKGQIESYVLNDIDRLEKCFNKIFKEKVGDKDILESLDIIKRLSFLILLIAGLQFGKDNIKGLMSSYFSSISEPTLYGLELFKAEKLDKKRKEK